MRSRLHQAAIHSHPPPSRSVYSSPDSTPHPLRSCQLLPRSTPEGHSGSISLLLRSLRLPYPVIPNQALRKTAHRWGTALLSVLNDNVAVCASHQSSPCAALCGGCYYPPRPSLHVQSKQGGAERLSEKEVVISSAKGSLMS